MSHRTLKIISSSEDMMTIEIHKKWVQFLRRLMPSELGRAKTLLFIPQKESIFIALSEGGKVEQCK